MNSPATARNGNLVSAGGMAIAIVATAIYLLLRDQAAGGLGRHHGLGHHRRRHRGRRRAGPVHRADREDDGDAAAGVAVQRGRRRRGSPHRHRRLPADRLRRPGLVENVAIVLDIIIGSITFTGSLIASGKLMGLKITPSRPVRIPGGQLTTGALALIMVGGAVFLWLGNYNVPAMFLILAAALVFGVTMTLPIGGADMPVVISLLNSFTGTAVAMAGFVLENPVLIIAGALVGASGAILTKLMADAMNRSVLNIMVGGFGGGEGTVAAAGPEGGSVRAARHGRRGDPARVRLERDHRPGLRPRGRAGPARGARARRAPRGPRRRREVRDPPGRGPHARPHERPARRGQRPLPAAPGDGRHQPRVRPRADVALVVGANDVTNPAARRAGTPVSGMPILDVDHAKSIIVMKRSMGRGYAGIDNELYVNPKTGMLFADAKQGLADLVAAVKAL